MALRVGTGA